MPRAQPRFEEVGGLRLPLGGVNGYRGVRGKQDRKKNKYQGVTPRNAYTHLLPCRVLPPCAAARARARHRVSLRYLLVN